MLLRLLRLPPSTFVPRSVLSNSLIRHYALSRFPDRHPVGSRRSRTPPPPRLPSRDPLRQPLGQDARNSYSTEDQPSSQTSPLWEAAEHRPLGSPESLKKPLLENNSLVVTRQIEMLNIFIGFEQTNKYAIYNEWGEPLGFIAEEPRGFLASFGRQIFRTHRPFRAIIMDRDGAPVLWIRRPFDWINSRMFVQRLKDSPEDTPDGEPILETFAEGQQRWHLWRRRYDLFLREPSRRILSVIGEAQPEPATESFSQFARIDEGLWAWHFTLRGPHGEEIASVNRAFRGFGREIFTDTGQYSVNFAPLAPAMNPLDPISVSPVNQSTLTLEERALVLAMAVNVDFDYFSRHSEGGHGFGMPFLWSSSE